MTACAAATAASDPSLGERERPARHFNLRTAPFPTPSFAVVFHEAGSREHLYMNSQRGVRASMHALRLDPRQSSSPQGEEADLRGGASRVKGQQDLSRAFPIHISCLACDLTCSQDPAATLSYTVVDARRQQHSDADLCAFLWWPYSIFRNFSLLPTPLYWGVGVQEARPKSRAAMDPEGHVHPSSTHTTQPARRLTSFEELRVQVRQAAGDGVGEPTAAYPVAGLEAQVATQGALEGVGDRPDTG